MTTETVIPIRLGGGCDMTIAPGLLSRLGALTAAAVAGRRLLLAVDERIADHHGVVALESLQEAGLHPVIVKLRAAESDKTLAAVHEIYEAMLGGGLDRGCAVVALGGGIVGDTAGFAAATFLRGVPLIQAPTTLLAMVDASIGGKTGVNFDLPGGGLGKNMIGAFWQPTAIAADPQVLSTLDDRNYRCGLAECVKAALIADASLLDFLAEHADALEERRLDTLMTLIERCARIKIAIVESDEREAGPRALLNLGHTFAHAIEARPQLDLRHGEAVSIGLSAAAHCAVETGHLSASDAERVDDLLERLGLPLRLPEPVSRDDLMRAMRYDKKARGGRIRLVLPVGLVAAEIVDDVPVEVVEGAWNQVGAA